MPGIPSRSFLVRIVRPRKSFTRRCSVVVAKRISPKAVIRNRLRRQVSEAIRKILTEHSSSPPRQSQVVVSVKTSILPPYDQLRSELLLLLQKSGMLPT